MKVIKTKIDSGGFRVAWLIPIEGLFAFSMLTVGLKYGFGLALLVVLPAFVYIVKKAADNVPKVNYDAECRSEAVEPAMQNTQKTPLPEDYAVADCRYDHREAYRKDTGQPKGTVNSLIRHINNHQKIATSIFR